MKKYLKYVFAALILGVATVSTGGLDLPAIALAIAVYAFFRNLK